MLGEAGNHIWPPHGTTHRGRDFYPKNIRQKRSDELPLESGLFPPPILPTTFGFYRGHSLFLFVRSNGASTDPLACSYGRKALNPRTSLQARRRST